MKWYVETLNALLLTTKKKAIWKGYILYDSSYITFWKRQNYGDSKKICGCWGLSKIGGERDELVEHREFLGSDKTA